MNSRDLKRLTMLLPTVAGMTLATVGHSGAYQLGATDYANRIASALESKNVAVVMSSLRRLRSCGVESLSVGGTQTSLGDIEDLIQKLIDGKSISVKHLVGDASFVIGPSLQTEVQCSVMADGFVADDLSTHASGGGGGTTLSST